ncbi:hypothetical protein FQA47_017194 [Oryzias melastigma]|uniref:Uncharacterized protein n=1 Tax=Oryzias melastigma TaxID=30732 RepID=A0A834C1W4_ORYME|nr:hypothetical protein FQA47_017194 [Oryzias melastigma]
MASQRALLVVYLVSLVNVRSAKCLGREEVGRGERNGTGRKPQAPPRKLPYIHGDPGVNSAPNPQQGRAEPGTNTLLFEFKKRFKKKKQTASLSAESLFNQLHKKCTEIKKKNHIVQIYVTSTPEEIIKQ